MPGKSTARMKMVPILSAGAPSSDVSHNRPDFSNLDERDPLYKMQAVQIARELLPQSWDDAHMLAQNEITKRMAGQLYAAMASILANLAEGYSRSSGRDRARIFEFALGSVRESMMWYRSGDRIIGRETVQSRLEKLEQSAAFFLQ
ncbi:MAG TPA: four helix bundle protein [Gemmatimonadaceae bacterium]|nr:four helix bundle protein [Gemmatimonadaceae bacterium]